MGMMLHDSGDRIVFVCDPRQLKAIRFMFRAVFNEDPQPNNGVGFDLPAGFYLAAFAYRALIDMGIPQEQVINILRFFRDEFLWWMGENRPPFILSLNDGKYAVLITEPACRKVYDYVGDVDRTNPSEQAPLPVPIVQASVNLARAVELELDIR